MEPQSRTFIAFTGPFRYTPENRLGMRALRGVLDIRLREVIREELSGTYGVGVQTSYEKYPEARYTLGVSFGSDPARVDELVAAVFAELERIKEEGPSEEDVQKVKEQERRTRETNLERNEWWLAQLRYAEEYGSDPHFLLDTSLLDRVTVESVQADARSYLRTDNYVQVTLLPAEGEEGGG
jgi:zinc protease